MNETHIRVSCISGIGAIVSQSQVYTTLDKAHEASGAAARASDAGCKMKAPLGRLLWLRRAKLGPSSLTLAVQVAGARSNSAEQGDGAGDAEIGEKVAGRATWNVQRHTHRPKCISLRLATGPMSVSRFAGDGRPCPGRGDQLAVIWDTLKALWDSHHTVTATVTVSHTVLEERYTGFRGAPRPSRAILPRRGDRAGARRSCS